MADGVGLVKALTLRSHVVNRVLLALTDGYNDYDNLVFSNFVIRIATKVVANGVAVEDQHGGGLESDAWRVCGLRAVAHERKVREAAREVQETLRPLVRSVATNSLGHPAAVGDAVGFSGLVDQGLRSVV